jgi:hypothetical protein
MGGNISSFHDPLNSTGKEAVMADILSWIASRLPAAAQAQTAPL